jgi:uncharacterized protein (TIGR02453 family)
MTEFSGFPKQTLTFLRGLASNNNREWFQDHRSDYERWWLEPAEDFVSALAGPMRKVGKRIKADPRVNGSIFRINRDTRFSKDKTPYKDHLDLWFWEGERKTAVSGCFFRLTPAALTLGAGAHGFDPARLGAYREAVADVRSGAALMRAMSAVEKAGWEVHGEHYKAVPRGFTPRSPVAERLLRHAGLWVGEEKPIGPILHSPQLVDHCVARWSTASPIHRWLVANLD